MDTTALGRENHEMKMCRRVSRIQQRKSLLSDYVVVSLCIFRTKDAETLAMMIPLDRMRS